MKKYYCLKEGSKKVNGSVIELDTDERTIKETTNFEKCFKPEFKYLRKTEREDVYRMILKSFRYDIDETMFRGGGFCITKPAGSDLKLEGLVNETGIVKILSKFPKKTKVYLSAISEEQAEERAHEAFLYSAQLDYICGA